MFRVLTLALVLGACNGGKDTQTGDTGPTTTAPSEVTDTWTQTLSGPVDILWVLDRGWTSGLAALDRDTLDDEFELFLLSDANWKFGVLDATAEGSDFGLITPQFSAWPAPDPFGTKAAEGPSRVREVIHLALELRKDANDNQDFIRSDAGLYVVVFTDGKDESENPGTGTGVTSQISQDDFDVWFRDFQPSDYKKLSVITTGDGTNYWSKHLQGGGILEETGSFRKAIQGVFLDAIGQKVTFPLSQVPADPPATARVTYREHATDYVIDADYAYDPVSNSITFLKVIPEVNSTISVTYLPSGDLAPTGTTTGTSSSTTGG
jgi:hypothetical protein